MSKYLNAIFLHLTTGTYFVPHIYPSRSIPHLVSGSYYVPPTSLKPTSLAVLLSSGFRPCPAWDVRHLEKISGTSDNKAYVNIWPRSSLLLSQACRIPRPRIAALAEANPWGEGHVRRGRVPSRKNIPVPKGPVLSKNLAVKSTGACKYRLSLAVSSPSSFLYAHVSYTKVER